MILAVAIVALIGIAGGFTWSLASGQAGGSPAAAAVRPRPQQTHSSGPATPLQVMSVSPASETQDANGSDPVTITFNAPLAAGSPLPSIKPATGGSWAPAKSNKNELVFTPSTAFKPESTVKVSVPAGPSGVRSAAGGLLATTYTAKFHTTSYSTLRLQQLLAQLGYLPLTWAPASGSPPATGATAQLQAAYSPPAGSFSWQSGYPGTLKNMWSGGSANLIDVGAIRAFESVKGLTMDGVAGPAVWRDLLQAAEEGASNPNGYTYAIASKADPETLTIWHNGRRVLHTYANTGIPAAPTYDGTYPVYERLPFQIMKGTNPDGSKYADPVQNVSYFHGGEAVHYFPRGSYGWQQSLGCVELPLPESAVAYRYLTYGSLVTVKA